jgi:putative ABC transport system substrate-binding protein
VTTRRTFITTVAGGLLAAPLAAQAQQAGKVYRIGLLGTASRETMAPYFKAFEEGLRELGYVEGRNMAIERRYADLKEERYPDLAAELVRLPVDVMVAGAPPAIRSAKQATTTIPIVMVVPTDPVGDGFITSLRRPGGNITGLTSAATPDTFGKNLEILKQAFPRVSRVAVLAQPSLFAPTLASWKALEEAARKLRVTLHPVEIRSPEDLANAFATIIRKGDSAVYVRTSAVTVAGRHRIADLALRNRLPSMYDSREFVDAGGLMHYGVNIFALYRRAATYVDKILQGAKPGDLPIEQPTKFEFVINLKTAKALGLTIPQSVLARADEVIQ